VLAHAAGFAKKEAIRLARLNPDDFCKIEDKDGHLLWSFYLENGKMIMATPSWTTLVVDDA
jgi:hypothetical protein